MVEKTEPDSNRGEFKPDPGEIPVEDWQRALAWLEGRISAFPGFIRKHIWWAVIFAIPPVAAVVMFFVVNWTQAPKYALADCIVRVDVNFPPNTTERERFEFVDRQRLADRDYRWDNPMSLARTSPSLYDHLGSDSVTEFYLLARKCNDRYEIIQRMVDSYTNRYPHELKRRVRQEKVRPGTDTITDNRPFWTDTMQGRSGWQYWPEWYQRLSPYILSDFGKTCVTTDQYRFAKPLTEEEQREFLVMVADTLPRRFPHHKLLAKSFKFNAAGNEVSFQYRGPCEIDAQREYSERFISAIFDAYPYPTIKMLKHYEETVDAGK